LPLPAAVLIRAPAFTASLGVAGAPIAQDYWQRSRHRRRCSLALSRLSDQKLNVRSEMHSAPCCSPDGVMDVVMYAPSLTDCPLSDRPDSLGMTRPHLQDKLKRSPDRSPVTMPIATQPGQPA